eukprot:9491047-Pyramimonas_sp.AAC.1
MGDVDDERATRPSQRPGAGRGVREKVAQRKAVQCEGGAGRGRRRRRRRSSEGSGDSGHSGFGGNMRRRRRQARRRGREGGRR